MQCQKCPILAECGGIETTFNYVAWLAVPTRIEPYGKTECPLLKTITEHKIPSHHGSEVESDIEL